jgi:hypothetical protein
MIALASLVSATPCQIRSFYADRDGFFGVAMDARKEAFQLFGRKPEDGTFVTLLLDAATCCQQCWWQDVTKALAEAIRDVLYTGAGLLHSVEEEHLREKAIADVRWAFENDRIDYSEIGFDIMLPEKGIELMWWAGERNVAYGPLGERVGISVADEAWFNDLWASRPMGYAVDFAEDAGFAEVEEYFG